MTDGIMTRDNVNGDLYIDPDTALDDVKHGLTGMTSVAAHHVITQDLDDALDESVVMFGFDAHAIATSVRRATGFAARWEDHDWQVILPTEIPIHTQVALDQILTEDVA